MFLLRIRQSRSVSAVRVTDGLFEVDPQVQQGLQQIPVVVAFEETEEVQQGVDVQLDHGRRVESLHQALELRNVVEEDLGVLEVLLESQAGEGLRDVQADAFVETKVQEEFEGVAPQLPAAPQFVLQGLAEQVRNVEGLEVRGLVEDLVDVLLQVDFDFLEHHDSELRQPLHQVGGVLEEEVPFNPVVFRVFLQELEEDPVETQDVVEDRRQHFDSHPAVLETKSPELTV